MTSWRVATFNIRHGLGPDERVDLARTADEIRALGAEVVGLQEVDVGFGPRSDHDDQAARLGELLGMRALFGAALDLPPTHEGGPRRRYGIALLTDHEIIGQQSLLLPQHPGRTPPAEPRCLLHARLRRRDGEQLDVLVTHLDNESRAHRTAQVQGIVDRARQIDGPTVLLGDMNADPGAPELAALSATGWREAAAEVDSSVERRHGSRPPSPSVPVLNAARSEIRRLARPLQEAAGLRGGSDRLTHPARFPLRRIDAVWLRGPLTATALETGPAGSSDHLPVTAMLRTGGPGAPAR